MNSSSHVVGYKTETIQTQELVFLVRTWDISQWLVSPPLTLARGPCRYTGHMSHLRPQSDPTCPQNFCSSRPQLLPHRWGTSSRWVDGFSSNYCPQSGSSCTHQGWPLSVGENWIWWKTRSPSDNRRVETHQWPEIEFDFVTHSLFIVFMAQGENDGKAWLILELVLCNERAITFIWEPNLLVVGMIQN